MTEFDPVEFGRSVGDLIREVTDPLVKRIAELEARQPERGEKGDAGPQGTPGDVGPIGVAGEKGDAGATGLQGEKGEAGTAGRDADPIDVKEVVYELLTCTEIKTLVDMHVAEAVQKHFENNPVQHGQDGNDGDQGIAGERGEKGDSGADGCGLAGAMIDREGCLIVTTTKGDPIKLGVVVGKDGGNGENGIDGLGFDDLDIDFDGERSFTFRWKRGEVERTKTFIVPTVIDRGYWREGTKAKAGDGWTNDGSWWIAKRDTDAKPCRESPDWRIGARKGRDGERGEPGKAFKPDEPVKLVNGNA